MNMFAQILQSLIATVYDPIMNNSNLKPPTETEVAVMESEAIERIVVGCRANPHCPHCAEYWVSQGEGYWHANPLRDDLLDFIKRYEAVLTDDLTATNFPPSISYVYEMLYVNSISDDRKATRILMSLQKLNPGVAEDSSTLEGL